MLRSALLISDRNSSFLWSGFMRRRNLDIRIQIEAGVHFFGQEKLFEYFKSQAERLPIVTRQHHTFQLPYKSWWKTARMILTTKTRPHHQRLHCSYFSIPYFYGEMNQEMNRVFLRIQIEVRISLLRHSKILLTRLPGLLQITCKIWRLPDILIHFTSFSWQKCRKIDPATDVRFIPKLYLRYG